MWMTCLFISLGVSLSAIKQQYGLVLAASSCAFPFCFQSNVADLILSHYYYFVSHFMNSLM